MRLHTLFLLLAGSLPLAAQTNLLEDAVSSQTIGANPSAPWVVYNSAGAVTNGSSRAYIRDLDLRDSDGTVRVIFTRWGDGYTHYDILYTYPVELEGGYEYNFSVFTGYWNNFPGDAAKYIVQPVDNLPTLQVNITTTPGLDPLMMPQSTDDWTFTIEGANDSEHWLASQTTKTHTFYAPGEGTQTYYLSFVAPAGIYPIGDLSLVKGNAVDVPALPSLSVGGTAVTDEAVEMRLPASGKLDLTLAGDDDMFILVTDNGKGEYSTYSAPVTIDKAGTYSVYYYAAKGAYHSVVKKITLNVLPAQISEGNLLRDALNGQINSVPQDWKAYNRAGDEVNFPGNATLRNADMGTTGFVEMLALRWDGDIRDVYYTYRVNIPTTGVYDFSMRATEWNNYNEQNSATSQLPGMSGLRVSLTSEPGYNYLDTQSFIFDMPGDHPGANKTGPEGNPYNLIQCNCAFFAEAGEYYLSFTGSSGLYPVSDLSLTLRETAQYFELPAQPDAKANGLALNDEGFYAGVQKITFGENENVDYIWLPEGDTALKRYLPFAELSVASNGTLYAYQIVDGIHGKALEAPFTIGPADITTEMIHIEGGEFNEAENIVTFENEAVVTFTVTEDMEAWWIYVPSVATSIEYPTKFSLYEVPVIIKVTGDLQYYPIVEGERGKFRTIHFVQSKSGVADIGAETAPAEYFTLDGKRVATPTLPGIYIERRGTVTRKLIRK